MSPDMFIRKICHDLRAPLRALSELPDWLEEDLINEFDGLPDCSHETLRMMKTQSKRLDEMVAGLSNLVKMKRSGPANTSLPQVLSEIAWADHVYIHLDVERFPMESTHVKSVLDNLVENSFKHGGQSVEVWVGRREENWLIAVSDDGPGIPEELHEKVYEPLCTLKPRDQCEGSGLGLTIVKKLAELYNGTSLIRSNRETGVTVEVIVPTA